MMRLALAAALSLGLAAATPTPPAAADLELVPTPYGLRPKICVLEVPDGAFVDEDELGVLISHPSAAFETYRHVVDPICSLPEHAPRPSMHMYAELDLDNLPGGGAAAAAAAAPAQAPPPMNRSVAHCDVPPCTCDALPCNNWIDNAGYMTGETCPFRNDLLPEHSRLGNISDGARVADIGGMSSVMTVPKSPPKGFQPAQTLFYFIGAENTDGMPRHGAPPPSGRAILQPVRKS